MKLRIIEIETTDTALVASILQSAGPSRFDPAAAPDGDPPTSQLAPPIEAPRTVAKSATARTPKRAIAKPAVIVKPAQFDNAAPAAVEALLRDKPMTSGELVDALKRKHSSATIYAALSMFRKNKQVLSESVDGTLLKVNKWIGGPK